MGQSARVWKSRCCQYERKSAITRTIGTCHQNAIRAAGPNPWKNSAALIPSAIISGTSATYTAHGATARATNASTTYQTASETAPRRITVRAGTDGHVRSSTISAAGSTAKPIRAATVGLTLSP